MVRSYHQQRNSIVTEALVECTQVSSLASLSRSSANVAEAGLEIASWRDVLWIFMKTNLGDFLTRGQPVGTPDVCVTL